MSAQSHANMLDGPAYDTRVLFNTRMSIKATGGSGSGTLSGYAAVFNNRDRVGDVIVKGAFALAIPDFLKDGVILARHGDDSRQPIAFVTKLREDDYGLYFEGEYHSTFFAQQERTIAQERLANGKSVGNSIMFMPYPGVRDAYEWTTEGRTLKALFLGELTTNANLPVNPKAVLREAKGVGGLRSASAGRFATDRVDHRVVLAEIETHLLLTERRMAKLHRAG